MRENSESKGKTKRKTENKNTQDKEMQKLLEKPHKTIYFSLLH